MSIQPVNQQQYVKSDQKDLPLIDSREIKAILSLGIRGSINQPKEKHVVDISV